MPSTRSIMSSVSSQNEPESQSTLGEVGVIGGGIAGLAAAHFLVAGGAKVTVFESSDQFGGLGAAFRHNGNSLDRFYRCILPKDDHFLELCKSLDIDDRAYWKEASLAFIHRRKLYPLRGAIDLLRFGPVPFHDRLRLGMTALYGAYVARPDRLDDITAETWLTRLSGRRAFQRLWGPLLEAKFGDAHRQIPALWYWASFNREKGTGKEIKGYLKGGYRGLTEALVSDLRRRGVTLKLEHSVDKLSLQPDRRPTVTVGGHAQTFDRVVTTVPFIHLRRMCADGELEPALAQVDRDIDYQGVLNVLVLLKRRLTGYYWIPVLDSDVPFRGIVETTTILDADDAGGHHLVYLLNYTHRSEELFQRDPSEVRDEYVRALLELFPELSEDEVAGAFTFKAPFVEPIYRPGYGARKPPAELFPHRVYLATTTQIYPNVTSWNSSIRLAKGVVRLMHERVRACR